MGKHSRTLSSICHKMMHTFQQYVHYVTVDTVEPLWEKLEAELQKAKDINSVIALHQNFILKVMSNISSSQVYQFGGKGLYTIIDGTKLNQCETHEILLDTLRFLLFYCTCRY